MSANNGAAYPPLLKLGDLSPDTRPVSVERAGTSVILTAYVDGPRCPGYVKAKVAKAREAYGLVVYADGPPDEHGATARVYSADDAAWDAYLRDSLMAVIEGLTYPEAEVLSGNQDLAIASLRALGWIRAEAAGDDPPEAPGDGAATSSTTDASSPDSPASMDSRRKRS
jgi:hypothetical protein